MGEIREIYVKFDMDLCDTSDIASFRNLMVNNGYQVIERSNQGSDDMGGETAFLVLFIPIIPKVIEELATILKVWLDKRHVKFKLEDKKSGRSIQYESASSRISDKQLKQCIDFLATTKEQSKNEEGC